MAQLYHLIKQLKTTTTKHAKILKTLTSTKWGKQKKLTVSTFKAITRSILKNANTIWSPIISNKKLKTIQTQLCALLLAAHEIQHSTPTRQNQSSSSGHHFKLHATQLKQLTQTQTYPLHDLNAYLDPPRNMKATIFHNNDHTNIIISEPDIIPEEWRENLKHIHTTITSQYLSSRKNNKVTNTTPYDIHSSEQTLPRHISTKLAQLRANKSPLLQSYLQYIQ